MEVLAIGAAVRSATAPAVLRARRNPFTGRVSYVDPSSVRGLRARVPRALLAIVSASSLVAGIAFAAGTGASHHPSVGAVSREAVPLMAPTLAAAEDLGTPARPERR